MKSVLAPEWQTASLSLGSDVEAGNLSGIVREIHELIACRAFQFFGEQGHRHGHDLEDWFRAESEILLPVAVETYEFDDRLITHIQVPTLTAEDLEVSVEPRR